MKSQTSNEIKRLFKQQSISMGYKPYDTVSVVADPKSNLLFNISGKIRFQDELLEVKKPADSEISVEQNCVRLNDLDKVGLSGRHHMFFEMLNRYMFYTQDEQATKEKSIVGMYNFLTKELGLDKSRLQATAHPQDTQTIEIWKGLDIPEVVMENENVFTYPYDYANKTATKSEVKYKRPCREDFIELFDMNFTEFDFRKAFENRSATVGASFGGCLDRLVSSVENTKTDYQNSMWKDFVEYIKSHNITPENAQKMAEMANLVFKLLDEGIAPTNTNKSVPNSYQGAKLRRYSRCLIDMTIDNKISMKDLLDTYYQHEEMTTSLESISEQILNEQQKYDDHTKKTLHQVKKQLSHGRKNILDYNYLLGQGLPERNINELLSGK